MFVLLVSIALLAQASSAQQSVTKFHFQSFGSTDCNSDSLNCTGSVTSNDGFLSLTPQEKYQVGRVMYKTPIHASSLQVIFTSFTFKIIKSTDSADSGDGLSFIMASDANASPGNSDGDYLGIMDRTKDGSTSNQLAVEFDTYKNHETNDIDANHASIMTQSLRNPLASKSFNDSGIDLKSGKKITIKIVIIGGEIEVSAKHSGKRFDVKTQIDISKVLPGSAYVGFTAATGAYAQGHQLLKWSFSSSPAKK